MRSIAFHRYTLVLLAFASFAVPAKGAPQHPQREGREQLLALHRSERTAHFSHDTQWFLDHIEREILDVRDGTVNRLLREDIRVQFNEYFRNVKFSKWDDVEPPVVQVSPDGQMGWMIVRVRIVYSGTDSAGKKVAEDTVLAWMSAYEKKQGKWTMTAVTTTSAASK